jgi:hypothetical protein
VAYIATMSMNVSGVTEEKHENFLRLGGVLAEVLRLGASDAHPNSRGICCHWPSECERFGGSDFSCKQFTAFTQPPSPGCKRVSVPAFLCSAGRRLPGCTSRIPERYNKRVLEARLAGHFSA